MTSKWAEGQFVGLASRKSCPDCISKTKRCKMLIFGRDIGGVGAQHHDVTFTCHLTLHSDLEFENLVQAKSEKP